MNEKATKVFVYGTLKPGESNYQYYCAGKVRSPIEAYVRGKLYSLPFGYPAIAEGNNKVRGFSLTFENPNLLQDLDRLEGYYGQSSKLNEYYRLLVPVYDLNSDRAIAQAWCYFMSESKIARSGGIALTSGWWSGRQDTAI